MNRLRLVEWQMYWPKWHCGYGEDYDRDFNISYLFIFIGPLQMRFYRG